ncbi:photosystem reaction center subunit H [Hapalosiphon sp. MRB220]|nr:photosystem reaction center subunit H [Hapalosiphon sp. MRB220]
MALIKLDEYYPNYRKQAPHDYDITNFDVIAKGDEKVGSVESILVDHDSGNFRYVVVDTGFWILGKKILLPIGLGRIVYMDRRIHVQALTKEQIENLPEYKDNLTINPDYEERVRSVLRPLVAEAKANQVYNPDTYDLSQEPYFYEVNDQTLKSTQEKLIATKNRRE